MAKRFSRGRRDSSSGQAVVEFALIVPILLIMFLAVADVARIYTTMMTVESAAREASDFGSWNSSNWAGDPADPTSNYAKTVESMKLRGCLAARNLPDYVGPDDSCTNPATTIALIEPDGTPGVGCDDKTRVVPCRVKVTVAYDFHLLVPLRLDFFDVHFGLPATMSFTRDAIFAISDFDVDAP